MSKSKVIDAPPRISINRRSPLGLLLSDVFGAMAISSRNVWSSARSLTNPKTGQ